MRVGPAARESYGLRALQPHITAAMGGIGFTKMHGLGNDFVVVDARHGAPVIGEVEARAIADRRTGIGCDQLLLIEPPIDGAAAAFMRIRNADGGEVAACGNGIRCVAAFLMAEAGSDRVVIETGAGLSEARAAAAGQVMVDLGAAVDDWRAIPLAAAVDTLHLEATAGPLSDAVGVGIGNPHAVSASATRTRCSSSTTQTRWRSRSTVHCWNTTRCFRSAPTSASPSCCRRRRGWTGSACGYGSAASA